MADIKCNGKELEITIKDREGNLIVHWLFEAGGLAKVVKEEGRLICKLCGEPMKPHHFGSVHNPLRGTAFDFSVKCPNCSLYLTFGNPLEDKETAERIKSFAGKFVDWWSCSEEKEVKRRLKALGYW